MSVMDMSDVHDGGDRSGEGDRGDASRLDRAAAIARFLVSSAELDTGGLRLAVAIGKGSGVLALPLTEDAEALHSFLESLSLSAMTGSGTNLETLIDAASAAFQTNFPTRRHIVLFSDGESLSGSIQNALDRAVKEDIRITVVGLGSVTGGPVPLDGAFLLREDGFPVISALREDALRNAAEYTGGVYLDGNRSGAAASLSDHIRDIASEGFSTSFRRESRSQWHVFVIAALAALGISKLLEKGRGVKKA
jgi:Ca-activated chloride channel family protein